MDYISISEAVDLVIPIPSSVVGDTVTYEIIKAADGSVLASGSMTFVRDELWRVSYTPAALGVIILKVNDTTITSKRENIYRVVGAAVSPSGVTGSELSTLANVKEYLRITTADDDTLIQKILTRTSTWIQKYCNRVFIAADYTEYYDGDGTKELLVNQYPINSIASMYDDYDRVFGSDTAITVADLVYYPEGRIVYPYNSFMRGQKNIKITYNAGYATIPADLEQACIKMVASEYLVGQGALNTVEGATVDKPQRLKDEAMEVVNFYRRLDVRV